MSVVRNTDPRRRYYRDPATRSTPLAGLSAVLQGRVRFLVAGSAVAAVASVMASHGTFALWTDAASAQAGTFSSSTLDITLDGQLSGQGGSITRSDLSMTNMLPGESKAVTVTVKNAGGATLLYDVYGTGSGDLGTSLQVSVTPGGSATNATATSGFRTGSCGSGTAAFKPLTTGSTAVSTSTRTLTAGSSEVSCVIVRLDPDAASAIQGKSGSGSLAYTATQPTS